MTLLCTVHRARRAVIFGGLKQVKKYYYNTQTHRFEKLEVPFRVRLLRVAGFLSAALVIALIIVAAAFRFLESPRERLMRQDYAILESRYRQLQAEINAINKSLVELEQRDNQIYRSIFETSPLPDSVRRGKTYSAINWTQYRFLSSEELISGMRAAIQSLRARLSLQNRSYDTLQRLIASKEQMLAAIPAIQPIANRSLDFVASGFGYRIDPIYKTPKMHTGLDFAAPMGTPIHATANGKVVFTGYEEGGYGSHVIVDHGYGYETLYGHMVRIKVRRGQLVKRGETLGWVGSTGKSTGPHLHYEVIRNKEKINPVHYFFNDLTAIDYDRMVRMSTAANQSFD